jgi:hypothetical protein
MEMRHRRYVHLERLKKIKDRKPGSSKATLDNTPPDVIPALKSNPRKAALKIEFDQVTERENRSLLKRISTILTAPPKITDQEYLEMRKLCPSLRGPKEVYEQNLLMKHTKLFYKQLKKLGGVYDVTEWERDYRKQLFNQKFIRQVAYKRPKDFVDPLNLPTPTTVDTPKKMRSSGSSFMSKKDGFVHRVRSSAGQLLSGQHSKKSNADQAGPAVGHENGGGIGLEESLKRVLLASVGRRISTRRDTSEVVKWREGEVHCWLVDSSVLLLASKISEDGTDASFDVDAEVCLSDVIGIKAAAAGDIDPRAMELIIGEPERLKALASELVNAVEIRIEESVPRLVLTLLSDSGDTEDAYSEGDEDNEVGVGDTDDLRVPPLQSMDEDDDDEGLFESPRELPISRVVVQRQVEVVFTENDHTKSNSVSRHHNSSDERILAQVTAELVSGDDLTVGALSRITLMVSCPVLNNHRLSRNMYHNRCA